MYCKDFTLDDRSELLIQRRYDLESHLAYNQLCVKGPLCLAITRVVPHSQYPDGVRFHVRLSGPYGFCYRIRRRMLTLNTNAIYRRTHRYTAIWPSNLADRDSCIESLNRLCDDDIVIQIDGCYDDSSKLMTDRGHLLIEKPSGWHASKQKWLTENTDLHGGFKDVSQWLFGPKITGLEKIKFEYSNEKHVKT